MGTWRTHFSYLDTHILEATPDKLFCASSLGLFSFDLQTGDTRKLSKIDGLSDSQVSALAYNDSRNMLVIGYTSGYVDLVFENEIISIGDLATSTLDSDRSINSIAFKENMTFLATDIGVIVVGANNEVSENFVQIGEGGTAASVREMWVVSDSLIIQTADGIQSGNLQDNLLDFTSWNRYPGTQNFTSLTVTESGIFALDETNLMQIQREEWINSGVSLPSAANRLFESNGSLYTATPDSVFLYNGEDFEFYRLNPGENMLDLEILEDDLYTADGSLGLLSQDGTFLSPDGPFLNEISNLRVVQNQLFCFHAPFATQYNGSQRVQPYSVFSEARWETVEIPEFYNVSDVAFFNGNYYFGSIGAGLFDGSVNEITSDFSSEGTSDTLISSLAVGDRLWVASYGSSFPLHLKEATGEWSSVSSQTLLGNQILSIDLADLEVGWLGRFSGDVIAYGVEESQVEQINSADGLPASFLDVEIGIDDEAWVATPRGPVRFINASFIFSDSQGIRPTFEGRTLFDDQQINAILKDGGNRVWFGTDNSGLWVYDENISEQVLQFNIENSPMPSNRILQLAYNNSNGEVFILTDRGLVSYRSASSRGRRSHSDVAVFPNPVRPEYEGLVGMSGLARNTTVKVTDVAGNLVREIKANGGSASWDLMDLNGRKVQTGIYLIFSASSDGEETYVAKIAVIR